MNDNVRKHTQNRRLNSIPLKDLGLDNVMFLSHPDHHKLHNCKDLFSGEDKIAIRNGLILCPDCQVELIPKMIFTPEETMKELRGFEMRLTPEQTLKELRRISEKYKDIKTATFGIRISDMAKDSADTIEFLMKENERLIQIVLTNTPTTINNFLP